MIGTKITYNNPRTGRLGEGVIMDKIKIRKIIYETIRKEGWGATEKPLNAISIDGYLVKTKSEEIIVIDPIDVKSII